MQTFDYIIVGAGAAGCVLANRLSEDPKVTVALIEAGPGHRHPLITMPKGLGKMLFNPKYSWPFPTEPEPATHNAPEDWLRGKVMGGSTSVNGMMYVRGQPADFDALAAVSSADWAWPKIVAAYRALEAHELGAEDTRGADGPLQITLPTDRTRLTEAMVEAGVSLGLPRKTDVNTPDNGEGIGYAPRTILNGRRVSAATAFIDPVRSRANLSIFEGTLVDRVGFNGKRAESLQVRRGGQPALLGARREIILCGGTLASPAMLQRSGVGDAALLNSLGIAVVADRPQVGQNLAEHRGLLIQWELREPISQNSEFAGLNLLKITADYFLNRRGPMAAATYEVGAWLKSRPELERPDLQFLLAPFSFDMASNKQKLQPFPGMHTVAYGLRPTSRGDLAIASTDPAVLPRIRPNFRSTEEDRRGMIDLVKAARRYAAQAPLAALIKVETYPGPDCVSDDAILEAFDQEGTCGFHAVGTCRMGSDDDSVVDPELRVRGVEGLRVIDASVLPQIPSGNIQAPVYAVAWRAADLILGRG